MADEKTLDPKTEGGSAAISAAAGIGRGCPFCAHREKTINDWRFVRDPGPSITQIECKKCGARGPRCVLGEEAALAAWNERAHEGGLLQMRHRSTLQ